MCCYNQYTLLQLDGTGVSLVTDIIEDLVGVQDDAATVDITHTLSNILDVSNSSKL